MAHERKAFVSEGLRSTEASDGVGGSVSSHLNISISKSVNRGIGEEGVNLRSLLIACLFLHLETDQRGRQHVD